ncbi:gluconate 2-dehydrogenase subunit 3 family protein [Sporosarcina sp. PTS2304]|uniref:gluconate 2-dehydrogenase subunit 3 family protein n=1 Tax=Sporosarcina sp. PTS2304 TaxID=2283194 RepID=UPI000E0CEA1A|nr:gluconate 2-dehydrogenase subunit 3 family protein [Sporosarcina sp. PTS2304]AXI00917.1 gluconate 2-dehydrogenase subunit 3 family protein [Sporosarcina sp. PTS2304]
MDHNKPPHNNDQNHDPSRRRFMKNTGLVIGGVAGGSLLGGLFSNKLQSEPSTVTKDDSTKRDVTEARTFFTRYTDFVVLEQASERIYPKDHNGPGAIELGVAYFIDKQLAGSWGSNVKDYRQAPFDGADAQAVNSRLTRGDLFLNALRKMNELSQERYDATFEKIDEEQQIAILTDFEQDKVPLNGVSSASFFQLLRMTVIEGAYADPLYGGNRNMDGWRMKEFPGPVPSYASIIESDEFVKMEPISLTDYQRKS